MAKCFVHIDKMKTNGKSKYRVTSLIKSNLSSKSFKIKREALKEFNKQRRQCL